MQLCVDYIIMTIGFVMDLKPVFSVCSLLSAIGIFSIEWTLEYPE